MSAWPTAASRRLELFSAFSGNPDGFVCLVYIALHCSAICKPDQCWLPIFQSPWHHHHLIPIMGGKKPLPSSSCWVWEGQRGTLCACALKSAGWELSVLTWHSTFRTRCHIWLIPRFSWVPIPVVSTLSFLHLDDCSFPGKSKTARVAFPDWYDFWHHPFHVSSPASCTTSCWKLVGSCTNVWEQKSYTGDASKFCMPQLCLLTSITVR